MQNLDISYGTYIDPNYSLNDYHPCPQPPWESPVMVHIHVEHITYVKPTPNDDDPDPQGFREGHDSQCFWCGIDLLKSNEESRLNFLSSKFSSLGIAESRHIEIANEISQELAISPYRLKSDEEGILKVVVEVFTVKWIDNWGLYERILEESMGEYERMNYGVVPASTESLAMLEKSVKVEEKSRCTICLDDLDEFASAMPCKHMFHDACIVEWLFRSHYCPICRFELPTDVAPTG